MTKHKNDDVVISEEDQNAFDEIQHMFDKSYIEPDQNVLELRPAKSKRASNNNFQFSASDAESIIKQQVNQWMQQNAPQIIRNILNEKIDELKK